MTVTQVAELVNAATQEALGETAVATEDLSNAVDVGRAIIDANAVDNYVKALVNRIGKVKFWDRPYASVAPNVLMDGWRFGSVMQKIRTVLPEATNSLMWNLQDNTDYSPNVFHQPVVRNKFFNGRDAYHIELSVTDEQVRDSFTSASQVMALIAMIMNHRQNSIIIKNDALIMRTIATAAINAFNHGSGTAYNLLAMYNTDFTPTLSVSDALHSRDFLAYAVYQIGLITDLMRPYQTLHNSGGIATFTPRERLKMVMLSDFVRSCGVYLHDAPSQFNIDNIKLPDAQLVPFWQGQGTTGGFTDRAKIVASHSAVNSGANVTIPNLLAVAFDEEALGVANFNETVTSNYNPRAHFTNYFSDIWGHYFVDFDEQCVVFYMAE